MDKIICFFLSFFVAIKAQFVIDRGQRDVFRNLTSCSKDTPDFCYFLHADKSASDSCICRCWVKYPLYRNPDVYPSGRGEFKSKGKPACVWHSNHRYECFHIRKLGRGRHTNDDEEALEFDFSKPGISSAFADNDLSSCTAVETSVKMPENSEFISKSGLLNFTYERYDDIIRFNWSASEERYDGGLLRGVLTGCAGDIPEAGRCFVGKITGMYNGGDCRVRALNGQCCILPFRYKGRVYNNCTRDGGKEAWCPVKLPFFGNETNWWQNCTDSKMIPSSSPVVTTHSLFELKTAPTVKPTETIKKAIFGLTVLPGPEASRVETRKNETISSSEVPGTNFLSKFSVTSTAVKQAATVSISSNKTSSQSNNRSAIIDYKSSITSYTPTTVNYTSSVTDHMPNYQSSIIDHRSSINYTSSVIDYQITPSTDFVVNFASSVSDNKVSMINYTVPRQTTIDYKLSASDHFSSVIDHSSPVHPDQSIFHSTPPASDSTSSIIDHALSVTVPEQSVIDYMHSSIQYTSSNDVSKLSISDHRSRMIRSISSISDYKITISGSKRTRPTTTNQYTAKTLFTGTLSPQTIVAPTRPEVRSHPNTAYNHVSSNRVGTGKSHTYVKLF